MCCTSTWPVNKQVLAFTSLNLFATHLIDPVYDDCSMKKQPISTAVVLEFHELLKWIKKWYWNLSELYECKHICHRDRFIFYIMLWVFHNASKPSNSATPFSTSTIYSVLTMWTLEITSAQFTRQNWNLRTLPHHLLKCVISTLISWLATTHLSASAFTKCCFIIRVLCSIILYVIDSFLRSFSEYSVYYLYNNGISSIHRTYHKTYKTYNKPFSSTPASSVDKSLAHIKKKSFKSHLSGNALYFISNNTGV